MTMLEVEKLCMRCMTRMESPRGVCSKCRCDNAAIKNTEYQLECYSILAGTYLVGSVLGQGGFGITYIGWDLNLNCKVAIKEYFPEGYVMRDTRSQSTVITITSEQKAVFRKGKDRFSEEAKRLAMFAHDSGIVGVRTFFFENETAYIVMDFIEGETLKAYITRRGGRISSTEALTLFRPLCNSLKRVHEAGLLHRDISPDNIMRQSDGILVLLDFGASRQMSLEGERSNTVNVKHGFAPEEQYRTRGDQGPWTDIYSLCATIYRITTGVTPPQALDRLANAAFW